jgi:xanthine dehydrogenase accessory factor
VRLLFQALADAARSGEPVALGIISRIKGSSPQKAGAKAVFHADGRIQGTLGGGCLEAEIQQRALACLRTGQAAVFELVLDHDFGWDDGLICGGKVEGLILPQASRAGEQFWNELARRERRIEWGVQDDFTLSRLDLHRQAGDLTATQPQAGTVVTSQAGLRYRETVAPQDELWIAGAGHIAQAVAPLALQLDFKVTVFDDRPALANHRFFPPEVTLRSQPWEELLAASLPESPAFGLIVTRGHRHDALVLRSWIHKGFVFVGMIGSARKARVIVEHFLEENLATAEELQRVACPVGIPIRAQTVNEIAVSIMAQLVEERAAARHEPPPPPPDAVGIESPRRNEERCPAAPGPVQSVAST